MPTEGVLNRTIKFATQGLSGGNDIFINIKNKGNQVTLIKNINWGIISLISPFVAPASTKVTGVVLQIIRGELFDASKAYNTLLPADALFFDVLSPPQLFIPHFLDFSSPLRIPAGDRASIIISSTIDGAADATITPYLTVIADQVDQSEQTTLQGFKLK